MVRQAARGIARQECRRAGACAFASLPAGRGQATPLTTTDPPAPPKQMVTGKWAVKQTEIDTAGIHITKKLTDHGLRALSTQFKPKKRGGTATW